LYFNIFFKKYNFNVDSIRKINNILKWCIKNETC
jgi:hypothetical protein